MTDSLTPSERSIRMARIGSEDTSPELLVRKGLHRAGFRFVLHKRNMPGRPDIVLPRYRAVVLVHGCFWHRHVGCKVASTPKSNVEYWNEKFERNVKRDEKVRRELSELGWRVFVIWECETRPAALMRAIERLASAIRHQAF
ncbi:DNA mismatch endonuclease Vsr [Mesorhizobium sp.]|uniref:very short patch repair endonuclease n=1 Tax=Mesorhizobium sp. TaxID=1871066 RepID=UPI000FE6219F|nr:DNA mismatch endonuclease Vsr [Mesorhizobium sp.]RWE74179.1 MAG: DNA mismatch endonuclease Vsr [Mesorhizobium sp.]TIV29484.1 MAG: DNA mismatch endonuclease Vsr [Mesorhizobium sp.]